VSPPLAGCLVVQVHDHRATPAGKMKKPGYIPTAEQTPIWSSRATSETSNAETGPEIYRIVLGPSTETLWSDLAQLSDSADLGWTLDSEQDALEMEAKILALTQPNLCLDPNFEVTRLANSVLRATTLECPEAGSGDRVAGRRGDRCSSPSEDEEQRTEAEHFMMMMDEGYGRAFAPTCVVARSRTLYANAASSDSRG
jgi:transcription factor SPT20